jgi:hypothetical protein
LLNLPVLKNLASFFSILLSVHAATAQMAFQKTYGDSVYQVSNNVIKTFDGGYLLTGVTSPVGINNPDVYVVKTDSVGILEWAYSLGNMHDDEGRSSIQLADSSYIIIGPTVQVFLINADIYLIHLDKNGTRISDYVFGTNYDYDMPSSITSTSDNGFLIGGMTDAGPGTATDCYVIKFDQNLNLEFANAYGDSGSQGVSDLIQTSDNNFVFVGNTSAFGSAVSKILICKINPFGDLIWSKTYELNSLILSSAIVEMNNKDLAVSGRVNDIGAGESDLFLLKVDSAGNFLRCKTIGSTGGEFSSDLVKLPDNNLVLVGNSSGFGSPGGFIAQTDSDGYIINAAIFPSAFSLTSAVSGLDGNIAISGCTNTFGSGANDMILISSDDSVHFCNSLSVIPFTMRIILLEDSVTFLSAPAGQIMNSGTVIDSFGIENIICTGTAIDEINKNENQVSIYPVPSDGNFIIKFSDRITKGEIMICNVVGENIFEVSIYNESEKEINVENITQGIYFVKVIDGKNIYSKKLIVEH